MKTEKQKIDQEKILAFFQSTTTIQPEPSSEELDKAVSDYLRKGGKIKKIDLEWREEELPFMLM
jgi:hypothetical protein